MQQGSNPIVKDLVLVGGGHSHAIALRMFGMNRLDGVRITLITEASDTAYSGMLPGHVAGIYSHEECHIDLRRLAQFAGAQLYIDRVVGLDLTRNRVLCAHRPPVRFDLLSLDIGSTPMLPAELKDSGIDSIIPAKPVRRFLEQWERIVEQITQTPDRPLCFGIVGGGAGGVELALNMQQRVQQILRSAQSSATFTVHLFQREAELLPRHGRWVRDRLHQRLVERGIQLHCRAHVQSVRDHQIVCESGLAVKCDEIFWVTQASAPAWISASGLSVDEQGFVRVEDTLRSCSHPYVFAAGDIATMVNQPRPKAGVFAVRQGKPLFQNLRRALLGQSLRPFHAQTHYLSLIGTADGSAIASWGALGWESSLLWRLKDRVDRAFMQRFNDLPEMPPPQSSSSALSNSPLGSPRSQLAPQSQLAAMRCAGCGSKVGRSVLERVLERIKPPLPQTSDSVLLGLHAPDDAAVLKIPPDRVLVQTVDYFSAIVDDPFVFGQICAHHALSDLFAMGATAQSALAIATVPVGESPIVEETLYQLLSGAVQVLQAAGAELIGGHTTEGPALAFGLTCNGLAMPDRLLTKAGMQPGQTLILTKAIGTGTLFAAHRLLQAKGHWIDGAIATMLQSNQAAAQCLLEHQATACTDVTGFGLVGHLLEMAQASSVAVTLNLEAVPILPGALEMVQRGIVSSLQPQNLSAAEAIENLATVQSMPEFPLLFDPQTSGGLLATVPTEISDRCLATLHELGYSDSAIVGFTEPFTGLSSQAAKPIALHPLKFG